MNIQIQELTNRLNSIIYSIPNKQILSIQDGKTYIKQIIQVQKELNQLKKDINSVKKQYKEAAKIASENAEHGFLKKTLTSSLLGKQKSKSLNAKSKRDASENVLNQLSPYDSMIDHIEKLIVF